MSIIRPQASQFHPEHFETQDEDSLLQQFSRCPSCRGHFVLALILPCSHPMCRRCLEAAAEVKIKSQTSAKPGPSACLVMCPCCRRPVELPCGKWTSAVSCLPQFPKLKSGRLSEERGVGFDEDEQKEVSNRHTNNVTTLGKFILYVIFLVYVVDLVMILTFSSSVCPADGDVDLQDEEMKQSVFGLRFGLDSSHIPSAIHLSSSSMTATYEAKKQPKAPGSVFSLPVLRGDVVIRQGQYYWEVDVCNSVLYRIGVRSRDTSQSWWFERRDLCFSAVYDGTAEPIYSVPPGIKTVGLFLNVNGGVISFYNTLSHEHLVSLPTRFDPGGVVPAFALGQGRLKIRTGLTSPPLVFHSKNSGYRGVHQGTEAGLWRRGLAFRSVKKVVEKFEELALSQ
ncbi:hypothetical protein WMY93_028978 [Mugilogobius chulae]|uniref:B30.2/SPRY domain-containing protein n=1 Tax=Mugilogobius chulae TaxID=88201 RepID=A0AAW0N0W2_9GOBI